MANRSLLPVYKMLYGRNFHYVNFDQRLEMQKAEIAALCHDIAKNMSKEDMADIIKENNIKLSLEESISKQLWHSILAPIVARKELKIEDKDILGAIRWHTTGKENMTKLEKII